MDIKLLRNLAAMDATSSRTTGISGSVRWTNADEAVGKVLTLLDDLYGMGNDMAHIESVYDAIVSAYVLPEEESDDE